MKYTLIAAALLCSTATFAQRHTRNDNSKVKNAVCLIAGGLAFSAAATLEGSKAYETYGLPTTANPQERNVTRKVKPFSQQYPRNIMLTVGVSFTVAGLIKLVK